MEELFEPENPVDGVVHVVAYGFVQIRSKTAREGLRTEGGLDTLEKFRDHQMLEEMETLKELCTFIRRCQKKSRKPSWILVVATKADLYQGELAKAEAHYAPSGNSPFVATLNKLRAEVGSDNLSWDAVPVCGWPEDFDWGNEIVKTSISHKQRITYVNRLSDRLRSLCMSK
jgi:hypothetical protein